VGALASKLNWVTLMSKEKKGNKEAKKPKKDPKDKKEKKDPNRYDGLSK
jgi:hypothetical protein